MDKYLEYILGAMFCILIATLCTACQPSPVERLNDWLGWGDDNIFEEAGEYIIESKSGIDVDLSPRSPE